MTESSPPCTKKVDTRELLLEVAERLFTEKGYTSVSTRELADAAGVNLAAIQYHFGSKAKLFVEVVHSLMSDSGCVEACLDFQGPILTPEDAAQAIAEYVRGFLEYLLQPVGPHACRLMLREVFTDHSTDGEMFETLVASVVDKFIGPIEQSLVNAISILNPGLDSSAVLRCARSIAGQCAFYGSHRTFLERLDRKDLCADGGVVVLASHIVEFSFRGIGCSEQMIREVIERLKGAHQQ